MQDNGECAEQPTCELVMARCEECDNEIEGICNLCHALVCGSCFNGYHEFRDHGQADRREWEVRRY